MVIISGVPIFRIFTVIYESLPNGFRSKMVNIFQHPNLIMRTFTNRHRSVLYLMNNPRTRSALKVGKGQGTNILSSEKQYKDIQTQPP